MIAFVPDNEKYTRLAARMDEEFVRGLRTFCERQSGWTAMPSPLFFPGQAEKQTDKIVCARQARLHLPGTVLS